MTAFQTNSRGRTPKMRVYDRHGTPHVRSLGTSEYPELADAVEAFVRQLRADRRWDVLDAIIQDISPLEAYRASMGDRLTEMLAQIASARVAAQQAAEAEINDPDIAPLVDRLVPEPTYNRQVRRLIPDGVPFRASEFTRGRISRFLADLKKLSRGGNRTGVKTEDGEASPATRNRHRVALSIFAKRLIENEIIETNPVRDVAGAKIKKRRITYHESKDVRALVMALEEPFRSLEALMAGTGMEWGACAALRRRDIDLDTRVVFAQGTKNEYRTRYVEVSEDWAWEIVRARAKTLTPNALFFPYKESAALRRHRDAEIALGLKQTTLHQHRNSFAVMHLMRGSDHQWIKNQLGHAPDSTLLYRTYGVYIKAAKLTEAQRERQASA